MSGIEPRRMLCVVLATAAVMTVGAGLARGSESRPDGGMTVWRGSSAGWAPTAPSPTVGEGVDVWLIDRR
jgi:hypothetical protein